MRLVRWPLLHAGAVVRKSARWQWKIFAFSWQHPISLSGHARDTERAIDNRASALRLFKFASSGVGDSTFERILVGVIRTKMYSSGTRAVLVTIQVLCAMYLRGAMTRDVIRLGYLTGSQRLPGDLLYSTPGRSISGAISFAVDEINSNHQVIYYRTRRVCCVYHLLQLIVSVVDAS